MLKQEEDQKHTIDKESQNNIELTSKKKGSSFIQRILLLIISNTLQVKFNVCSKGKTKAITATKATTATTTAAAAAREATNAATKEATLTTKKSTSARKGATTRKRTSGSKV